MNINKVFIYGNLTRDPETRQLPSGTQLAQLGIATNRIYNDQKGERQTEVEYHNVVFFGRLAELVQQYLKKGSGVFVEGRLRTSSWESDGVKKYRTEIIGEQMQFGPRRDNSGESFEAPSTPAASNNNESNQAPTINPEDIPF